MNNDCLNKRLINVGQPPLVYKFYDKEELSFMTDNALKREGLYPQHPGPVDVELLAELISKRVEFCSLPLQYEAATQFIYGEKPIIFFNEAFLNSNSPYREHRWRFMTAHECAHIILQDMLFQEACRRILRNNPQYDVNSANPLLFFDNNRSYIWYEWQANAGGANLLMPREHLNTVITSTIDHIIHKHKTSDSISRDYILNSIAEEVSHVFNVSFTAAKIAVRDNLSTH